MNLFLLWKQKDKHEYRILVYGIVAHIRIIKNDDLFGNIKNSLNKTVF